MKDTIHGFTLIELLVVVGIIGILVAAFLTSLLSARRAAVDAAALATLRSVISAAETARTDMLIFTSATECKAIPNSGNLIYGPGNAVESCQIIQDSDRTYGIAKSSTGVYHIFNGGSMFRRGTAVATSVTALGAVNTNN